MLDALASNLLIRFDQHFSFSFSYNLQFASLMYDFSSKVTDANMRLWLLIKFNFQLMMNELSCAFLQPTQIVIIGYTDLVQVCVTSINISTL